MILLRRLMHFFGDRRAATGLASVMGTLMCVMGTALLGDHSVLVYQRDVLQAASDAASIAAAQKMAKLDSSLNDAEVTEQLRPVVERYLRVNLSDKLSKDDYETMKDTLQATITPDRENGIVDVQAAADLGGAIFGRRLWGKVVDEMQADSGVERAENRVELALAIDVTGSMASSIYNNQFFGGPGDTRIRVVSDAAMHLLNILNGDDNNQTGHIAVGLVPFNTTVNIGSKRAGWLSELDFAHKVIPAQFGPWGGCIEQHEYSTSLRKSLPLSLALPGEEPFLRWFSPSTLDYRPTKRANLAQALWDAAREVDPDAEPVPVRGENDWALDPTAPDRTDPQYAGPSPHYGCPGNQIVPLTTDLTSLIKRVEYNPHVAPDDTHKLRPWPGGGTMMHVGVVWARRLLAPTWRTAWDETYVPPEEDEEPVVRRVLVLLSDGLNDAYDNPKTYPGLYRYKGKDYGNGQYMSQYTGAGRAGRKTVVPSGTSAEGYRTDGLLDHVSSDVGEREFLDKVFLLACELAKEEGIEVFTVSAIPQGHPKEDDLQQLLTDCASGEEDADGKKANAFLETGAPHLMHDAFAEIARRLQSYRRRS